MGFQSANGDLERVDFTWIPPAEGGAPPRLLGRGPTLSAEGLFPDAAVHCTAIPFDDVDQGDAVVSEAGRVVNGAPEVEAMRVQPADPGSDRLLFCDVTARDPDDDGYRLTYRWLDADGPIPGATGPSLGAGALAGAADPRGQDDHISRSRRPALEGSRRSHFPTSHGRRPARAGPTLRGVRAGGGHRVTCAQEGRR